MWNELTQAFEAVLARFGQEVTLLRDGTELGRGLALIQDERDAARQFAPTDRGIRRAERALCLASLTVPFDPAAGEAIANAVRANADRVSVRERRATAP